jgi:1-aminocyclopropane-1-carboxylate deaminase/D-cysteine desulfhydrase-like pyridoxal-dependent ACC family enzyme
MIDLESLTAKLESYPRTPLADYPTPLEPLTYLSKELGRPVFIKRDDQIGPGLGGSKTRNLEYLLAHAQKIKARKVVTFGGLQSNHARLTAAAACKLGMQAHLFYFAPRPVMMEGNLAINQLLGARLHFVPFGSAGGNMTLEATCRLVRLLALAKLGQHYFIPVGGHGWRGCLGYVRAALEIDQQVREMDLENAWLVTAAGTGGTLAGLMAGLALVKSRISLQGIDVGKLWRSFPDSIAHIAAELCNRLGTPLNFHPAQVPLIEGEYCGEAYAIPSQDGVRALSRLARSEGVLLDPVYTAKAFAGLLDLVERKQLGHDEPVIFLHTGGNPALFAGAEVLPLQMYKTEK